MANITVNGINLVALLESNRKLLLDLQHYLFNVARPDILEEIHTQIAMNLHAIEALTEVSNG
jgi:hypothetical protein